MKRITSLVCFLMAFTLIKAQDNDFLLGHDIYHYVDRLDISGATGHAVPTLIKPYGREAVTQLMKDAGTSALSEQVAQWQHRLELQANDSLANAPSQQTRLKWIYRNGRDLIHIQNPDFQLFINPVAQFAAGAEVGDAYFSTDPLFLTQNHRGVVVRGTAWGKLGFHTEVSDQLGRYPGFLVQQFDSTGLVQGETFVKKYGSENGLNYFSSRAYLTYSPFKAMRIKFGKDRAFWGYGYQSLWLSDYAPDGLLLTVNTRIWQLEYTNHFVQLVDYIPGKPDPAGTYPRKYAAFHQLSWLPNKHFSVGVFEGVVYASNQPNGNRGFELTYLNPIIFYRAVEQAIGSPDNSVLGAQGKVNLLHHLQFYGQFLLDDYNFSKRSQGSNYWGNKYAWQLGLKYIDAFGVPTLDLQMEYNRVRPYTYQHFSLAANYSQYGQPLAHSGGANLWDAHFILRYHPLPAWNLYVIASRLKQGRDTNGKNVGYDLNLPYTNRLGEYDQVVGQGLAWNVDQLHGRLTFQPFEAIDLYLEAEAYLRREQGDTYGWGQFGLRTALQTRQYR